MYTYDARALHIFTWEHVHFGTITWIYAHVQCDARMLRYANTHTNISPGNVSATFWPRPSSPSHWTHSVQLPAIWRCDWFIMKSRKIQDVSDFSLRILWLAANLLDMFMFGARKYDSLRQENRSNLGSTPKQHGDLECASPPMLALLTFILDLSPLSMTSRPLEMMAWPLNRPGKVRPS